MHQNVPLPVWCDFQTVTQEQIECLNHDRVLNHQLHCELDKNRIIGDYGNYHTRSVNHLQKVKR